MKGLLAAALLLRCPQKKVPFRLPLLLKTELAWGAGDPVTASFLRTTFRSEASLSISLHTVCSE